jgi:hypothetical protein
MPYMNDNLCICGHGRSVHYIEKGIAKWCKLNQKECDCFFYEPKKVEREDPQWI